MNKKKFFTSLLITLLVCAVIFSSMVLFSPSKKESYDFLDENGGNAKNVLVVGVDKDGVRADVIMLFNVNAKDKTMNLISIPRDTKVKVTGKSSKINALLGKENGEELLTAAVRQLTGMPVNGFCKVTFEGLRNIVDILGGVQYDVPIDMDYDDPVQDLSIHLKAGEQLLDGAAVEGLVRFRSGYANADLGRIDTQQDLLKEAAKQKLSFKYIFKFPAVMAELNRNFSTNLSALDILTLALDVRSCGDLSTYTLPGAPKYSGGVSYFIADENSHEQISALTGTDYTPTDLNDKVVE
jgi:LCP family protein required for cell wall assembly